MKNLREKNHITVTKEGFIYLTDTGRQIAEMIYERHELISGWLIQLGVDPETAVSDACRMEHVISRKASPQSKSTFWKTAINNIFFQSAYSVVRSSEHPSKKDSYPSW